MMTAARKTHDTLQRYKKERKKNHLPNHSLSGRRSFFFFFCASNRQAAALPAGRGSVIPFGPLGRFFLRTGTAWAWHKHKPGIAGRKRRHGGVDVLGRLRRAVVVQYVPSRPLASSIRAAATVQVHVGLPSEHAIMLLADRTGRSSHAHAHLQRFLEPSLVGKIF